MLEILEHLLVGASMNFDVFDVLASDERLGGIGSIQVLIVNVNEEPNIVDYHIPNQEEWTYEQEKGELAHTVH